MDLVFIIILLVLGMGLIVLELVAIPGTTISGISGLGLTIYGVYKVFGEYGVFWGLGITFFDLVLCALLLIYSLKTKTWKRFAQNEEITSKVNVVKHQVKVGDKGVSITRLAPVGIAMINDERVEVFTSTSYVDPNTNLVVEQVEGNKIRVKVSE
jgi:membrane-bound ClpP family serine protease